MHLRCFEGCDIYFHDGCWRKASVLSADGSLVTGRTFKWYRVRGA